MKSSSLRRYHATVDLVSDKDRVVETVACYVRAPFAFEARELATEYAETHMKAYNDGVTPKGYLEDCRFDVALNPVKGKLPRLNRGENVLEAPITQST